MMKAIVGKKIGMTQMFEDGKVVPVTLVQAGPVTVTQVKTKAKDGYEALQIGFQPIQKGRTIGKSKKRTPFTYIREFRGKEDALPASKAGEAGTVLDVSLFEKGEKVRVSGISKGKGFQGGVKRHGFHGRNASHGVKHEERGLGSTGSSFPERVIKGRKMPGRMGSDRITVKNLKIVNVDKEHSVVVLRGAVPGPPGSLLEIRGI